MPKLDKGKQSVLHFVGSQHLADRWDQTGKCSQGASVSSLFMQRRKEKEKKPPGNNDEK